MPKHFLHLVALTCMLSGCGGVEGVKESYNDWFGEEEESEDRPLKLRDFEATIEVRELWSDRYGKGTDEQYLKLHPALYEGKIFTADRYGRMIAIDASSGEELWEERNKKLRISGGPGTGDGLVFAGTSEAEVIARDVDTGEMKWLTRVSSEVLAAPVASDGIVIIRTGDGKMFGLNSSTGKRVWTYDRSIPLLTLRGTGTPVIHDGLVIAGFDNGRLIAINLKTGKLVWQTRLTIPGGRSDLERLVDLDSKPVVDNGTVYIAGFQGSVNAVSLLDGQLEWSREISSYAGLAVDNHNVYVTGEEGFITALKRADGTSVWRQEGLKGRHVTGPAVYDGYIVVGDFEGYMHWLDKRDGKFVNRIRIDDERIIAQPLAIEGAVLGYCTTGLLAALTLQ